ncbi:hypothetical protein [Lyngbya aestuarii]|uniref:hypothetical protein n=1 Tax=Lyngbya aestuarii TaxID=118322 RepID=UPI00403DC9E8
MAIIKGTAGSDTLIGSSNNDWIEGYAGPDMLTGGGGGDTFVFTGIVAHGQITSSNYYYVQSDDGFDIITDFNDQEDTILSRYRPSSGIPGSPGVPPTYKPVVGVNIIPNENDFASTFVLGKLGKFTDIRSALDPFFVSDAINIANVFQPDLNIGQLNQSISLIN